MKRIMSLLFALALLGAFALPALAADDTHRMTHGDDWQDALLVGKVIEVDEGGFNVTFEVVRTVNGRPAQSPFMLQTFDGERFETAFAPGDGILASVHYNLGSRTRGIVAYRVFKVELKQDKKIKMDVNDYDVGFIEWTVNTGEDNLYGSDENVYRHVEGQEEGELLFNGQQKQWAIDSLDSKYTAPEVKWEPLRPLMRDFAASRVLLIAATASGIALIELAVIVSLIVVLRKKKSRIGEQN